LESVTVKQISNIFISEYLMFVVKLKFLRKVGTNVTFPKKKFNYLENVIRCYS
jgi:hypothetical protein